MYYYPYKPQSLLKIIADYKIVYLRREQNSNKYLQKSCRNKR